MIKSAGTITTQPPHLFRAKPSRHRPGALAPELRGMLPALDDLFAEAAKTVAELGAAIRERDLLERQSRAAGVADAAAYADARRAGKPDPGPIHAKERAQKLDDANRHLQGLRLLRDRIEADIASLAERSGGELVSKALAERARFVEEREAHEANAATVREAVARIESSLSWLQGAATSPVADRDDEERRPSV